MSAPKLSRAAARKVLDAVLDEEREEREERDVHRTEIIQALRKGKPSPGILNGTDALRALVDAGRTEAIRRARIELALKMADRSSTKARVAAEASTKARQTPRERRIALIRASYPPKADRAACRAMRAKVTLLLLKYGHKPPKNTNTLDNEIVAALVPVT